DLVDRHLPAGLFAPADLVALVALVGPAGLVGVVARPGRSAFVGRPGPSSRPRRWVGPGPIDWWPVGRIAGPGPAHFAGPPGFAGPADSVVASAGDCQRSAAVVASGLATVAAAA